MKKKILLAAIAGLLATSTSTYAYDGSHDAIIRDGIIGGIIGAVIGNNTGDGDSRTGAIIGATTTIIKGISQRDGTTHSGYGKVHRTQPRHHDSHLHGNIALPHYDHSGHCSSQHVTTHVTYHKVWVHAKEVVRYGRVIRIHDGYWKYVPHVSRSGY